jgi:hypothetical protein
MLLSAAILLLLKPHTVIVIWAYPLLSTEPSADIPSRPSVACQESDANEYDFDNISDIDADYWKELDQSILNSFGSDKNILTDLFLIVYVIVRVPTPKPPPNSASLPQLRTAAR